MPQKIVSEIDLDLYAACREALDKILPPAHVAPGPHPNTLRAAPLTYVYLDCGRWGGTSRYPVQRNFGLVWGRWALLCEFQAGGGAAPDPIEAKPTPLDAVLKGLCGGGAGVRIVDRAYSASHVAPKTDEVYVFVPDLHLPVVRQYPRFKPRFPNLTTSPIGPGYHEYPEYPQMPSPAMGRDSWTLTNAGGYLGGPLERETDIAGTYVNQPDALCGNAVSWYEKYEKNDIFERAGDDLTVFLNRLQHAGDAAPIHLIQLGDMYELWNGLGRCFEETARHEDPLPLRPRADLRQWAGSDRQAVQEATPEAFVAFWVDAVNRAFPDLFTAFDNAPGAKTFLHGNHDNYLSVVQVPGRATVREWRDQGIFVEHGHRSDEPNRDGALTGYRLANRNFSMSGVLRPLEKFRSFLPGPTQRTIHIRAASVSFAQAVTGGGAGLPFCVYVMGHTHEPMIAQVTLQPGQPSPTLGPAPAPARSAAAPAPSSAQTVPPPFASATAPGGMS